jgi:hypothetical protein
MWRNAWLLVVGLSFAASGCDLDKPLTDPESAEVDERLLGRWVGVATDKNSSLANVQLFIGRHQVKGNPPGLMDALGIEYKAREQAFGNPAATKLLHFSTSKIGDHDFLNVFYEADRKTEVTDLTSWARLSDEKSYIAWTRNPQRSVLLVHYQIDGDRLKIRLVEGAKLGRLVDEGKLKKSDQRFSAASIAAYIEKNGPEELLSPADGAETYKRAP